MKVHLLPRYEALVPDLTYAGADEFCPEKRFGIEALTRLDVLLTLRLGPFINLREKFLMELTLPILQETLWPAVFPASDSSGVRFMSPVTAYDEAAQRLKEEKKGTLQWASRRWRFETRADNMLKSLKRFATRQTRQDLDYEIGLFSRPDKPGRLTYVSYFAAMMTFAALPDRFHEIVSDSAKFNGIDQLAPFDYKTKWRWHSPALLPPEPEAFESDVIEFIRPLAGVCDFREWCVRFALIDALSRCRPEKFTSLEGYLAALAEHFKDRIRWHMLDHGLAKPLPSLDAAGNRGRFRSQWEAIKKQRFRGWGYFSRSVAPQFSRDDAICFCQLAEERDREALEEVAAWTLASAARQVGASAGVDLPEADVNFAAYMLTSSCVLRAHKRSLRIDSDLPLFDSIAQAIRGCEIVIPESTDTERVGFGGPGGHGPPTFLKTLRDILGLDHEKNDDNLIPTELGEMQEAREGNARNRAGVWVSLPPRADTWSRNLGTSSRTIPGYLTVVELADRFGCSATKLHDWRKSGKIMFREVQLGKKTVYLFPDDDDAIGELKNSVMGVYPSMDGFANELGVHKKVVQRALKKLGYKWKEAAGLPKVLMEVTKMIRAKQEKKRKDSTAS